MRIDVRPLNKGEFFCGRIKKVKDMFRDTDVYLDFAYLGRCYETFAETKDGYYLKNKIKGYIIVSFVVSSGENCGSKILSFYPLKEGKHSREIQKEFESKYIHEFYRVYQEQKNNDTLIPCHKKVLLELFDGELKLHEYEV